ncbi:Hypothethical protein [Thiomonas delicata]|uniref:Hypothethical protein n=2 Tax=Thiomonas delicata TaxID=364030 RepID=A0A238D522_THIDL|nr:Hypothethical protein [Thiomonas delicata]
MNPRRVHKLMLDHFVEPPLTLDWAIVADGQGLRGSRLADGLRRHFGQDSLVIEVSRKEGAMLPTEDAMAYIEKHVLRGSIKIANRAFTAFYMVASNGVAGGWTMPGNHAAASSADGTAQGMLEAD